MLAMKYLALFLCLIPGPLGAVTKPTWVTKAYWDVSKIPVSAGAKCLADNIYHEARGESLAGQKAVAHVVLNRTRNGAWPTTVCGVVWDRAQFSWTLDKRLWTIRDPKAYRRAQEVARMVLAGQTRDPTGGATHYYEPTKVDPRWADEAAQTKRVGSHLFLKLKSGGA